MKWFVCSENLQPSEWIKTKTYAMELVNIDRLLMMLKGKINIQII